MHGAVRFTTEVKTVFNARQNKVAVEHVGSGIRLRGFKFCSCNLLVVLLWACIFFEFFSETVFFIYKVSYSDNVHL